MLAQNRVLRRLGDPEFQYALGGNVDLLACRRIAAHPGLAVHENKLAQSRNCEGVFGILVSEFREGIQGLDDLFFCEAGGFRK